MGAGHPTPGHCPSLGGIGPSLREECLAVMTVPCVLKHDLVSYSDGYVPKQGP